jgi:hypothetical protein
LKAQGGGPLKFAAEFFCTVGARDFLDVCESGEAIANVRISNEADQQEPETLSTAQSPGGAIVWTEPARSSINSLEFARPLQNPEVGRASARHKGLLNRAEIRDASKSRLDNRGPDAHHVQSSFDEFRLLKNHLRRPT